MKPKAVITIILLLFVATSIVYLAVGEYGGIPKAESIPTVSAPASNNPGLSDTPKGTPPTSDTSPIALPSNTPSVEGSTPTPTNASPKTYIVVYYFHGNYRCITCRTIEMYTREAVNGAFLKELGDGSLHLSVLNMQDPANKAYVDDFKLEYYVVVLEKVVDGKRVEWKKLEGVWDLLNDKDAFKKYVVSETRTYLKGINR